MIIIVAKAKNEGLEDPFIPRKKRVTLAKRNRTKRASLFGSLLILRKDLFRNNTPTNTSKQQQHVFVPDLRVFHYNDTWKGPSTFMRTERTNLCFASLRFYDVQSKKYSHRYHLVLRKISPTKKLPQPIENNEMCREFKIKRFSPVLCL